MDERLFVLLWWYLKYQYSKYALLDVEYIIVPFQPNFIVKLTCLYTCMSLWSSIWFDVSKFLSACRHIDFAKMCVQFKFTSIFIPPAPKGKGYTYFTLVCLSARPSVVCLSVTKTLSHFFQQLLSACNWNLNTLFVLACHMLRSIFVTIGRQLRVK